MLGRNYRVDQKSEIKEKKKERKKLWYKWGRWEEGTVRNDQCKDKMNCSCNKQDKWYVYYFKKM